jgi:hypothetical protein
VNRVEGHDSEVGAPGQKWLGRTVKVVVRRASNPT